MKIKINSWGNTHNKNITFTSSLKEQDTILGIGNNNSYGDASIPFDDYVLKPAEQKLEPGFFYGKTEIEMIMKDNKKMLFGIPGRNNVTLAGAVASDVHGKDGFWGGSFIRNVNSINLILSSGRILNCSRTEHPEIFYSTVGGFGLTGYIDSVELKLDNLNYSENFLTESIKGIGIQNLIDAFSPIPNTYNVAWINLLSKNFQWKIEKSTPVDRNTNRKRNNKSVNLELPFAFSFIGKDSFKLMSLINNCYFSLSRDKSTLQTRKKVLYPLNYFANTKNLAKNRKIIQVQFSIPKIKAYEIELLINKLIHNQHPILCSMKKLPKNETNLNLSFVQEGWTIAVDFPQKHFSHSSIRDFYSELIKFGGLIYLAKDSTLNAKEFSEMFKNLKEWKKIVKSIDPLNKFQSELSSRLNIKNW